MRVKSVSNMKARTGRPPRKDHPRRLTINLSERHIRLLNKLALVAPSRGYVIERLIEGASTTGGSKP
jgi:hypothetical protein